MTLATPLRHRDEIPLEWFDQLYRDVEEGWVSLFSVERIGDRAGKRNTDWAHVGALDMLAAIALDRSVSCCVWFGVATRKEDLGPHARGGNTDCQQIPAFWVDIDVAGPNHADNTNLPTSIEEAHELIAAFPVQPTAVVHTGGGLQAWWFLAEPIDVDTASSVLLTRWQVTWARLAGARHVDDVFDVARVMRLPGTLNRKGDPVDVNVIAADYQRRYGVDDLEPWLDEAPAPLVRSAHADIPYIGPQRPGDAYSAGHTGGQILEGLGFTLTRRDTNSDEHWTGPWKDTRQGSSATVYAEDGHTTVWSDSALSLWPALQLRRPYDPFGLLVVTTYAGDWSAAYKQLLADGYGNAIEPTKIEDLIEMPAAEPPPVVSRLELRWLPDTFTAPPPQPPELIRGLIREGEMCAMAAPRAIGKSWLAMNMAVMLGRGYGKIAGELEVVREARVLYAHGELDPYTAFERWFRMCGTDIPVSVAESFDRWRLRIVGRRSTRSSEGVSYSDEHIDAILDARLEETVDEHGIKVLIIDPWAVFYAGKENSNDETEAALDKLRDLSLRYGLAVVIVHHISAKTQPGHLAEPEDLWRGATRLADWASTRVTILRHFTESEAEERQLTRQEARRFADVKILRRGAPTPDFSMRMDFTSGWWQPWSDVSRINEPKLTPEGIAQKCREVGGFESLARACAHLDMHHSKVKPVLERAVVLGLLNSAPGAHGGTQYLPLEKEV